MDFHLPNGDAAAGPYRVAVTPDRAGWQYSGLRVLELPAGGAHRFDTGPDEVLVLPLHGGCVVRCDGAEFEVAGRAGVFAGVTDFAYLPCSAGVEILAPAGGRFALPAARAGRRLPVRYGPAAEVGVQLRGAGAASRQVHDVCMPEAFEADRLMVVEVLTPGGNWSSYPPHKHDEAGADECALEEIYYFEVRGTGGVGYQRVYASTPARPIDVLTEVRTGDVVLIPYGYHGPSMAAPGYDLYYLNVMAGPGAVREWRYRDDPAHAWIRDSWAGQPVDPRLPMPGGAAGPRPEPEGSGERCPG